MTNANPAPYRAQAKHRHPTEWWLERACEVILSVLDVEHAVTSSELVARASDRAWLLPSSPCQHPIDPHWLVNARNKLLEEERLARTDAPSKGHPKDITTWHVPRARGVNRLIDDASQRKRLLTARHTGWSRRGGGGRGLIGRAGENALDTALREATAVTNVSGSTWKVLGVDLHPVGLGEIDNTSFYIDTSDAGRPQLIQLVFEVKNTREWYYPDNHELLRFLKKVATIQQQRPTQLIAPIFVCRRYQYQVWELGEILGFLPVRVDQQLVLPDHYLTQASFDEVWHGLGFQDMLLGDAPTNRHRGMIATAIPRRALTVAQRWRRGYEQVLSDLSASNADDATAEQVLLPTDIDDDELF